MKRTTALNITTLLAFAAGAKLKERRIKSLTRQSLVAGAIALGMSGVALAGNDCTLKTLRATYVFTASGYNIVAGVAQPKAIIEVITFNGDGTLTVPAATRSVNGVVARSPAGGGGSYTVEASCTGKIAFDVPGPGFDIFISPTGRKIWIIQTISHPLFVAPTCNTPPPNQPFTHQTLIAP